MQRIIGFVNSETDGSRGEITMFGQQYPGASANVVASKVLNHWLGIPAIRGVKGVIQQRYVLPDVLLHILKAIRAREQAIGVVGTGLDNIAGVDRHYVDAINANLHTFTSIGHAPTDIIRYDEVILFPQPGAHVADTPVLVTPVAYKATLNAFATSCQNDIAPAYDLDYKTFWPYDSADPNNRISELFKFMNGHTMAQTVTDLHVFMVALLEKIATKLPRGQANTAAFQEFTGLVNRSADQALTDVQIARLRVLAAQLHVAMAGVNLIEERSVMKRVLKKKFKGRTLG
jgi:hypothetical protein